MACDKRYGGRRIWLSAEAAPNTPATFIQDSFLITTGSTFPALSYEVVENGEIKGGRGQYTHIAGSQSELNFELTTYLPDFTEFAESQDKSLALLFWALGSNIDDPAFCQDKIDLAGGNNKTAVIALRNSSTCGRTLQIAGLDRDGLTCEILSGCLISQAVITLNRTEQPSITFSGVASKKYELNSFLGQNLSGVVGAPVRASYKSNSGYGYFSGLYIVAPNGAKAPINEVSEGSIVIGSFDKEPPVDRCRYIFELPTPANMPVLRVKPENWGLYSADNINILELACQSLTITIEGGNRYGELTTAAPWPTEILSGQVKISGQMGLYVNDEYFNLISILSQGEKEIIFKYSDIAETYIKLGSVKIGEVPAVELSSNDEAATVELSFNSYNGSQNSQALYLNGFTVDQIGNEVQPQ